jgi:hypothetical protein
MDLARMRRALAAVVGGVTAARHFCHPSSALRVGMINPTWVRFGPGIEADSFSNCRHDLI